MHMFTPMNACRLCGASSYRRVIERDETGAMRHRGLFACSGCSVVFTDPGSWRENGPEPTLLPPPPENRTTSPLILRLQSTAPEYPASDPAPPQPVHAIDSDK